MPDLSKINGSVVVGAMNQAFFTLSVGMGAMAIFGSYIGKERSLRGGGHKKVISYFLRNGVALVTPFPVSAVLPRG